MKKLLVFSTLFLPGISLAAPGNFSELINLMIDILNQATVILFGLAVMFFMWNTMKGLFGEQSASDKKKQGDAIMWGIIILFVMFSFWGILHALQLLLLRGF